MSEPAKNRFDVHEFMRGQRDCKHGEPHKSNQSEDYDRGYSTQYQHEQNLTAQGLRHE